ncbi:hypothetical protein EC957_001688 [Mortierella hygrophila]|uniref:Periplasmic binding protein n=1 Tax=Mortierella hygrophila TaxID=979708 RepID=A0A9P6F5C2_9FUNG|nr:hypothetical protein EC957_001688 [Mortierella hygrophila]
MAVQNKATPRMITKAVSAILLLAPFLVVPTYGQQSSSCVTTYDPTVDYFSDKSQVDGGALFSITYNLNYKVVKNTSLNTTYILTLCGTPAPNATVVPQTNTTIFIQIPVTNLASLATTAVSYIEMLGQQAAIKAVDTEGLVSSPCVQAGLEKGTIVGLEDSNSTLRAEQMTKVDVVFSSYGVDPGTENKTVITSEVEDSSPLNRAEWLEFYATFFNAEKAAQTLTASINNNYNCYKSAATTKTSTKPIIAWASYDAPSSYNNNTASWLLSSATYKSILSTDAGATFFNGTDSSSFSTSAAFATAVQTVDILIDESVSGSTYEAFLENYQLSTTSTLKFIQNKAVFREDGLVNPNDGRDWFGGAVAMDDAVLQDLVRAVHPELFTISQYNWIRNIAKNETMQLLTSANCTVADASTPVPDRALSCASLKAGGGSGSGNSANGLASGVLTLALGLLATLTIL